MNEMVLFYLTKFALEIICLIIQFRMLSVNNFALAFLAGGLAVLISTINYTAI